MSRRTEGPSLQQYAHFDKTVGELIEAIEIIKDIRELKWDDKTGLPEADQLTPEQKARFIEEFKKELIDGEKLVTHSKRRRSRH